MNNSTFTFKYSKYNKIEGFLKPYWDGRDEAYMVAVKDGKAYFIRKQEENRLNELQGYTIYLYNYRAFNAIWVNGDWKYDNKADYSEVEKLDWDARCELNRMILERHEFEKQVHA